MLKVAAPLLMTLTHATTLSDSHTYVRTTVTDCGIGAHGIAGFADVLGGHRGWLQELGLTANPLGSDGAIALANMLATNTSLRRLELQGVRATALMSPSLSVQLIHHSYPFQPQPRILASEVFWRSLRHSSPTAP